MKYCPNCGKENTSRICPACGSKQTIKQPNYCGWCGNELSANATICPNCKIKVKQSGLNKLLMFVGIFLIIPGFLNLVVVEGYDIERYKAAFGLIIAGTLLLPFVGNIIFVKANNNVTRLLLTIARTILAIIFIGLLCLNPAEPETVENRACTEAVEVFHQNVRLKNEQSFQVNEFNIRKFPYDDGTELYRVVIFYSAQNGFGGMGSDSYTVDLMYYPDTDTFQVQDAHE